ncbi:MAG: hypothetical protein ABWY16_13775 [Pedobacter sp.]|uniref:hypothetical protein n=1 Tax=Pedobacter sp. TaxID=1411316 RepID=UPI003395F2C0
MKRLLSIFIMALCLSQVKAQPLKYFQGSLEDAKLAAKKQHKLIYLMVGMGTIDPRFSLVPTDKDLLKRYESDFICIYNNVSPGAGVDAIYQQYNVTTYPTHLFLDEQGGLILKTVGYRSNAEPYLNDINQAIQLSKGNTLTHYHAEYAKGNRKTDFLKSYLLKYDELDIPVNQEVLETYANLLPVSKLDDFETVSFLIQRGPVLSGTAYKITRVYPKLTDSIYKTLPYEKRVRINNRIINASMTAAKAKKDESLAMQTASFTQATWTNNWQKGMVAQLSKMMEYYRAVNDTVKYLRNASSYYQQYYLLQRDSIHKPDPLETTVTVMPPRPVHSTVQKSPALVPGRPDTKNDSARIVNKTITKRITISSLTGSSTLTPGPYANALEYAATLNNGAWSFYTMKTTNADYLSKAVIWVWRSIELFPANTAFYDTLAHLYYLQKKYDEAITTEQKAIDISQAAAKSREEIMAKMKTAPLSAFPDPSVKAIEMYTAELEKMKQKTL